VRRLLISSAVLAAALCVGPGCVSRAELSAQREGMDRATRTIREQHLQWANVLATDPANAPHLTAADLAAVQTAHREYEALVKRFRDADAAGMFGGGTGGGK
jgi:hypothetical protein